MSTDNILRVSDRIGTSDKSFKVDEKNFKTEILFGYDYYKDKETGNYWNKMVDENPENLLFWFDFLDAEGSEISKYAVYNIGDRTKSVKDTNVKSIYYREIPTTIF